ncbi:hypothetical protein CSUI_004907, partial [Cystoisospora suis]
KDNRPLLQGARIRHVMIVILPESRGPKNFCKSL